MYKLDDVVRSRVTAQGMERGRCYVVARVSVRRTAFGGFTAYDLSDEYGNVVRDVGNGHLVLELVLDAGDDGVVGD